MIFTQLWFGSRLFVLGWQSASHTPVCFSCYPQKQNERSADFMNYIKHPIYPPEKLDGKKVAWGEHENYRPCHFRVGKVLADGSHELFLYWAESISTPTIPSRIQAIQKELPLDQQTVGKIEVPESGSELHQMGYAFAILADFESDHLAVLEKNQKPS